MTETLGLVVAVTGAALGLWCILTFVFIGKGTQAPFDAPRLLVIRGPYRALRNPMYAGATLVLAGAAIFYGSLALVVYALLFWLATHIGVVFFEEPALRRLFGGEYERYCTEVGRWWPQRKHFKG